MQTMGGVLGPHGQAVTEEPPTCGLGPSLPLSRPCTPSRGFSHSKGLEPRPGSLLSNPGRAPGLDLWVQMPIKPLETLQVSIGRWEWLAGTLVSQGSERNKNRWWAGKATIFLFSSSRSVVLPPGSRGLLAAGAPVQGRAQVAEVMEGLAPALTRSGLGGSIGSFHLQRWRKRSALASEVSVGNFPPACQEPLRGTGACLFSLTHSFIQSLTHLFIH